MTLPKPKQNASRSRTVDMNLVAATDERDDAGNIAAFDVAGHRHVQICDSCLVEFVGSHRRTLMPFFPVALSQSKRSCAQASCLAFPTSAVHAKNSIHGVII